MMEKNIIFLTNLHLWSLDKGKGGRAFISTVDGYLNNGWNVWFVSTGGGVPEGLIPPSQLYETSFPLLDKLYKSKFRLVSIVARFIKIFATTRFYKKVGRRVIKNNPRSRFVIYAYEVYGVKAGKYLSKKFNMPLVSRFQGTIHSDTPNNCINRIKKAPYLDSYSIGADLTIMTNDGTKGEKVLERFNNKSKRVLFWRNGVNKVPNEILINRDDHRKELGFNENFVFLTVSRLVNWKRVDRAILGLNKLVKQSAVNHNICKLFIIGDGAEMDNLKTLVNSLSLDDHVIFLGAIEQSLIYKYMVACDVFLSLYDLSNVGNPLMEAMMCGKPIITLDVGDTGSLIKDGHNGIMLTKETLGDLPEKMNLLIEDKSLRDMISQNAFQCANEQFWDWTERIQAEIGEVQGILN